MSTDIYDKKLNWNEKTNLNKYIGLDVSLYDAEHLANIIYSGEGDWMDAYLFRFLFIAVNKADNDYLSRLVKAFPNHCRVLLIHRGWTEESVRTLFSPFNLTLKGGTIEKIS